MAAVVTRPVVGAAAALILSNARAGVTEQQDFATKGFLLKNVTGTGTVYLGPAGVTSGNGFQWDPADGPLIVELEPGEELYAIRATVDQTVHVLAVGR